MKNTGHPFLVIGLVLSLLCAAAAGAFASGDSEDDGWIVGSGHVRSEDRDVPSFTAIELEGSGNVTIRQGLLKAVSVETDDNVLPQSRRRSWTACSTSGFRPGTHVTSMTRLEFTVDRAPGFRDHDLGVRERTHGIRPARGRALPGHPRLGKHRPAT